MYSKSLIVTPTHRAHSHHRYSCRNPEVRFQPIIPQTLVLRQQKEMIELNLCTPLSLYQADIWFLRYTARGWLRRQSRPPNDKRQVAFWRRCSLLVHRVLGEAAPASSNILLRDAVAALEDYEAKNANRRASGADSELKNASRVAYSALGRFFSEGSSESRQVSSRSLKCLKPKRGGGGRLYDEKLLELPLREGRLGS